MTYYVVKIVITAALVVLVSEVAKRSSLIGAIIASIVELYAVQIVQRPIATKPAPAA